jgi:hypothetical protein
MILEFGQYKIGPSFSSFVLSFFHLTTITLIMAPIDSTPVDPNAPLKKKSVSYKNLALGASKFF